MKSNNSTQKILKERERHFPVKLELNLTKRSFRRLTVAEVFHSSDIKKLKLKSTKEKDFSNYDIISQERAVRAIAMGLGIQKPGYNIYVAGVQGTGRTSVIKSFLEKSAVHQKTPHDWIYVYNFKTVECPRAIPLATGQAKKFKKQMDALVETLVAEIPDALQSKDYEDSVNATVNLSNDKKSKLFGDLEKSAKKMSFGVKSTRVGIVTVPIVDSKPLSEKDYADLSDKQKEEIENNRNQLEPEVLDFARKVRAIESETKQKLDDLRARAAGYVVSAAMDTLFKTNEKNKDIVSYLKEVKEHILENLDDFVDEKSDEEGEGESESVSAITRKQDQYLPYRINVFVDHTDTNGAPIIIENNPTFYNLFGKIEKNIEYGVYTTDFKMIKAGALARANGGYLVLNAVDIFRNPQVWETLKRVLKNQKLYIEDLGEQISILPTSGLRPEPIALNLKIILIGSDWIYRTLYQYDEDFNRIFKIKADFDVQMDRTSKNTADLVRFLISRSKVDGLLPFHDDGLGCIVEFGSRLADDQGKLTTRFSLVKDLAIESNFIAQERNAKKIQREDVEKAIEERYLRSTLVEDHLNEMIQRGDILLSTHSRRIGEINGLAVYNLGDVSFGKPVRITCRVFAGKPGIINIERDASLAGRIHNKGVGILSAWINSIFGKYRPVELSASICFEQNYSGVDGDSATLAQVVLILTTIAEIPLDQGIAVTGSANQFGEVQPIGGVNEKIEGFFKTCKIKGLNGRQGVIIPTQNVKHLMVNRDVREAIEKNMFHIWPVSTVEEAFELLTGFETGVYDSNKNAFSEGSAFALIEKRLAEFRRKNKAKDEQKPVKTPVQEVKKSKVRSKR